MSKSLQKLNNTFTKEVIQYYKENKDLITEDLLDTLRTYGNPGKQIAIDILDLFQDNEAYYLDAFGNQMTFNGNRRLKKPFTKLDIADIHKLEIAKCSKDIFYFMNNYVKIKTKTGINFPELRQYQNDFLDIIILDDNESIVSLQPRQSGKSVTVAIYLAWMLIFEKDMNIGIAANKAGMAREFLDKTKNILIELPPWLQQGMKAWNKTFIESENGMRIITDATSQDSFRGFSCHIVVVDEVGFIRSSIWNEFADSIFPSQSALAFKKTILISTANGLNQMYDYINGARNKTNGFINYEVSWRDVPRFNPDGTPKDPDDFRDEIIAKYGIIYFNQNYGNDFIGSSHTLLDAKTLEKLNSIEPEIILDGKLNIYHKPEKGHQYIMAVDPAKDGKDAFAIQVIDITNFNFRQVASAKLQIDYLLMPAFIDEWCAYYNNPYLIIENNEGAGQSVADQMYQTYEYENLHFDKSTDTGKRKKYPGTRTTSKSRKQILQTLKTFVDNDNLEINDSSTVKEFFTFILTNNKYQADDGCHDDMVMSLALTFTLFNSTKNFEDMKVVADLLFKEQEDNAGVDVAAMITVGGFDDGTEENDNFSKPKEYTTYEEFLQYEDGVF